MMSWNWSFISTSLAADSWLNSARSLRTSQNAEDRVRILEDHLDHLIVITQALWEISRDRLGISEAELIAKSKEIAARGQGSGHPGIRSCPKCNRAAPSNAERCLYCGAPIPLTTAFEKV